MPTTNLGLATINQSDNISPTPINQNMEKIDALGVDYIELLIETKLLDVLDETDDVEDEEAEDDAAAEVDDPQQMPGAQDNPTQEGFEQEQAS